MPLKVEDYQKILLGFFLVFSAMLLAFAFYYSHYGFDLTDEGYYINSISYPFLYDRNLTLFGFVYHALYVLVGKNWILLRQFNILIIFSLSFILAYQVLTRILPSKYVSSFQYFVFSFAAATTSLFYFTTFHWLISPSYNSLNFIGFLMISIGLMYFNHQKSIVLHVNLALIAVGACIIFMSKMTSIFPLSIFSLFYLLSTHSFSFKKTAYVFLYFMVFLLLSVFFIDQNFSIFIDRFVKGYQNTSLLVVSDSIFRLDMAFWNVFHQSFAKIFVFLFILYFILLELRKKLNIQLYLFMIFSGVAVISFHANLFKEFLPIDLILLPPLSFVLVLCCSAISNQNLLKSSQMKLAVYFFLLPYAFAFGTSNPYWHQSQLASYFWVMSALCCISCLISEKNGIFILFTPVLFISLSALSLSMYQSLQHPYRQSGLLAEQMVPLKLNHHSKVFVSSSFQHCMAQLRKKIKLSIQQKSFDLIDLTGRSPGVVYLLNGIPVGAPWLLNVGGVEFLKLQITPILKQHKMHYLLINDKTSVHMLKKAGVDLKHDYRKIVSQHCELPEYELPNVYYKVYQYKKLKV